MSSSIAKGSSAPPDLFERIGGYIRPAQLIMVGVYFFILTLAKSPMMFLFNFEKFRHKAFARLWAAYGQALSEEMPEGTAELVATASGVVLDVGPGSGTQLHLFTPSKITKVYGAEPAVDMHPQLKLAAEKQQLGEKYEILDAGAEPHSLIPALAKKNILASGEAASGVFDTILSLRALCGVPNPEETAEGLYRLLKPGGRLLVVEHVKQPYPNGGDLIGSLFQKLYMLVGWKFWLGGCCLNRDTEATLRKVAGPAGWSEINLTRLSQQAAIPYIVGEMVKAY